MTRDQVAWPTLSDARRDAFRADAEQAAEALERLTALTVYAGGGGPAHLAREAARNAAAIKDWLDE